MEVLYEDNHIIVVNKRPGEIVQGDKTGDTPVSEAVKAYIKERYAKPGEVFLGVVHRLDRPVGGVLVFARTSKALARLNTMFASHEKVRKIYHALVPKTTDEALEKGMTLTHWLTRNTQQNKSYAHDSEVPNSKKAVLDVKKIKDFDHYSLLEVVLRTGRHHQIRCQLAKIGLPIKGDLKYGAKRSNPDGSISLEAHRIVFEHPVKHETVDIQIPEGLMQ